MKNRFEKGAFALEIWSWMRQLEARLRSAFGERLVFLGLQGSRARGEATANSDIDAVVILDEASMDDLEVYNAILDEMPERSLSCGFVAGRRELENWERSDLLSLCLDTVPVWGSLEFVQRRIGTEDVRRAVRIGACNLYHGAVHNFLHGKCMETLASLYKGAVFTVRTEHYLETGEYIQARQALVGQVNASARSILEAAGTLREGQSEESFEMLSERLIQYCAVLMDRYAER